MQDGKGTHPSGMKIWDTPPGKSRPAEVLSEDGGNAERVVNEGSHKYYLRPWDQMLKLSL